MHSMKPGRHFFHIKNASRAIKREKLFWDEHNAQ